MTACLRNVEFVTLPYLPYRTEESSFNSPSQLARTSVRAICVPQLFKLTQTNPRSMYASQANYKACSPVQPTRCFTECCVPIPMLASTRCSGAFRPKMHAKSFRHKPRGSTTTISHVSSYYRVNLLNTYRLRIQQPRHLPVIQQVILVTHTTWRMVLVSTFSVGAFPTCDLFASTSGPNASTSLDMHHRCLAVRAMASH